MLTAVPDSQDVRLWPTLLPGGDAAAVPGTSLHCAKQCQVSVFFFAFREFFACGKG